MTTNDQPQAYTNNNAPNSMQRVEPIQLTEEGQQTIQEFAPAEHNAEGFTGQPIPQNNIQMIVDEQFGKGQESANSLSGKFPRKQKSPFTPEEDARLRELISEKGDKSWNIIASLLPNRTARQCRERWNLYLSPQVNNEPWTQDDVIKLYTLYKAVGPQWTLLSHHFPNRTANNIKNRLKQFLRRAQRMYRIPDKATIDAAMSLNKAVAVNLPVYPGKAKTAPGKKKNGAANQPTV